jgi:hypothetical protein
MCDILVTHLGLNRTRIVSGIRQKNASVAQLCGWIGNAIPAHLGAQFSGVVTAANHASWMEGEVIASSSTPTISVSMV